MRLASEQLELLAGQCDKGGSSSKRNDDVGAESFWARIELSGESMNLSSVAIRAERTALFCRF